MPVRSKRKDASDFIVDRSGESLDEDPEIIVVFPDDYKVRFWKTGLSDEEYIRRAKIIRANVRNAGL